MGKVEQELVLRKQEDVEGDRERMSILSSRMLFSIPAISYYPSSNRYNNGGVFRRIVPMLPVRGRCHTEEEPESPDGAVHLQQESRNEFLVYI